MLIGGTHLREEVGFEAEQVAAPVDGVQVVQVLVYEQPRRPLAQVGLGQAVPAARGCPPRPPVALRHCAQVAAARNLPTQHPLGQL